ncbi:MAG TPA: homoserine kinase [Anaeromyxobacteraceae bacterium]|nr:homoserine kinase [Anaeromyxobacteraceae bacterium]
MALYTPLTAEELGEVAARYGLPPPERHVAEPKGSVNTNYHLWAGGRRLFLRLNEGKTDEDVEFETGVLRFLESAGYPSARLLLAADGAAFVRVRGRQAMLFAFCPGEELAREAVRLTHVRQVGEHLGWLHALAPGLGLRRRNPYGPERVGPWLDELGPDGGGDEAVRAALPMLHDEFRRAQALPAAPGGLVHGDLFVDNLLWTGPAVSAVLDWEMACTDAFAWDLAVGLNAWCYTDAFQPDRVRALLDGYRSRAALDAETRAALHPFARYVALRYTASRIHAFHLAELGEDRLAWKDWSRYRDRLRALRDMGQAGFAELLGA